MNRIAVVTGANRGIGREVARQLADQGDVVYLSARRLVDAETTVGELGAATNLHAHQLNVTDTSSIDRLRRGRRSRASPLGHTDRQRGPFCTTPGASQRADLTIVHEALEPICSVSRASPSHCCRFFAAANTAS